jgi:hypothetical protein
MDTDVDVLLVESLGLTKEWYLSVLQSTIVVSVSLS